MSITDPSRNIKGDSSVAARVTEHWTNGDRQGCVEFDRKFAVFLSGYACDRTGILFGSLSSPRG